MVISLLLSIILAAPLQGITVFSGDKPEAFTATILDTLPQGIGPRTPLILVRLHGAKIEHTGVIAGMSGSPVYREGELIGAVGYRIGSFSKEPIAGITPIAAMREAFNGNARASRPSAALAQVHLPLVSSGMDAEVSEPLIAGLNALSPVSFRAVAGGGRGQGPSPEQLIDGGALAVVLAHGDINLFALGTVTEVKDGKFLGFGHPMFGWGSLQIPVATAWVSTTIASPLNAFKVGRLGKLVGTMTQDRLPAIGGTLGAIPSMIPITVELSGAPTLRAQVVRHRRLTPSLLASVVHQAARQHTGFEAGGTLHLSGSINTELGKLPIDEWVAHPHHPGLAAAVVQPVRYLSSLLADNPLGAVLIKGVTLKLEHRPDTSVESLRQLELLHPRPRAGTQVEARLLWRGYQNGERRQLVSLPLPKELSPGEARFIVASGSAIDALEAYCGDGLAPTQRSDLLPWINARASSNSRGLFLVRKLATQSHGSRRALSDAWTRRLPKVDSDAPNGDCLIIARRMLPAATGPVDAQMSQTIFIQGAQR
jgi:hypothetical protein